MRIFFKYVGIWKTHFFFLLDMVFSGLVVEPGATIEGQVDMGAAGNEGPAALKSIPGGAAKARDGVVKPERNSSKARGGSRGGSEPIAS